MRPDSVIPAILSSVSGNTKELHLENMENAQKENLTAPLKDLVKDMCFGGSHGYIADIVTSALGNDAGIIGAANLVVNTRPEMDLENAKIMTESFKETAGEPLCIRKAKAFRRQCREKTVKIWDQELIVGCSGMIMKQRMR